MRSKRGVRRPEIKRYKNNSSPIFNIFFQERSDWEATLEEILEAKNEEAQNEVARRVAKKETQKYQLEQAARKYAKESAIIEREKNAETELIKKDLAEYHKENETKKEQIAQEKQRMMDSYFGKQKNNRLF